MTRKNKFLGYIFIAVGVLSLLAMGILERLEQKEIVRNHVASLPSFSILSIHGNLTRLEVKDKPVVLFFFHSTCEHCQEEAKYVVEHRQKLQSADVYFLSTENLADIQKFAQNYQLHPFQVGQVKDQEVSVPMGIRTFPTCFVYAKSGVLLKQFQGQIKIDAITALF